ncbi:MAG: cytochrome c [Pseudomonadales bacterium]|nr:cytochrome c [Pseudomonadales bacterium]
MKTDSNQVAFSLHQALCASMLAASVWPATLQAEENGEQLFLANCAECHQADGQGIPNIYPALDGNETVNGSGVDVALVLRIGRGEMPSFMGSLTAEEMAAIINYVRNAWSNSGQLISAETIESLK